jgi:hypothetical protein
MGTSFFDNFDMVIKGVLNSISWNSGILNVEATSMEQNNVNTLNQAILENLK